MHPSNSTTIQSVAAIHSPAQEYLHAVFPNDLHGVNTFFNVRFQDLTARDIGIAWEENSDKYPTIQPAAGCYGEVYDILSGPGGGVISVPTDVPDSEHRALSGADYYRLDARQAQVRASFMIRVTLSNGQKLSSEGSDDISGYPVGTDGSAIESWSQQTSSQGNQVSAVDENMLLDALADELAGVSWMYPDTAVINGVSYTQQGDRQSLVYVSASGKPLGMYIPFVHSAWMLTLIS
ncbi:MAG: hypothetical protein M1827_002202 [Pycnora praestabilis]|nr:MAG: hypothetical protein M1827_002202 [Pycnora praestabilis]